MNGHRERYLRMVEELAVALRRPPYAAEVGRALDVDRNSARQMAHRLAQDGLLVVGPRTTCSPRPLRVSPAARVALGLPLVVYLAWSVPRSPDVMPEEAWSSGCDIAESLACIGVPVVSPYLVCGAIGLQQSESVAMCLASTSHAIVVWMDRMLLGRADVDAARRAGVPVSVVPGRLPESAAGLWIAPLLQPS